MSSTLSILIIRMTYAPAALTYPRMTQTLLPHRAVLEISGTDTLTFLERVLTNEIALQPAGETRYTALLTPQGKVLVDFMVKRVPDDPAPHVFLDVPASEAEVLKKRLTMFRLRADAAITMRDDLAVWHSQSEIADEDVICVLRDPRHQAAGHRLLRSEGAGTGDVDLGHWHTERIRMGLAEYGFDHSAGTVFPSDINMDMSGGIDLKKGCFIGQEVVSRMHRRGKIRRRTVMISGTGELQISSRLESPTAGLVGEITSTAGSTALARIRLDRLARAESSGERILAGNTAITIEKPDWLQQEIATLQAND